MNRQTTRRILGLDPGLRTTGFGCIESDGLKHRFIGGGVITTDSKQEPALRLATIYDNLISLITEFQPAVASIEKLFFFKNVTSAIKVAQAQGVLMLACQKSGVPSFEYTPLQIKMVLSGYGRAEKSQVQFMVQKLLLLPELPKPADCADALGAALTLALESPPALT